MNNDLLDPTPWIIGQSEDDDGARCTTLQLPPDYIGFKGHFPDRPILPGLYHVVIATRLIGNHLGKTLQVRNLNHGKFMAPLTPGQSFTIICRIAPNESGIAASVKVIRNDTLEGLSKFKLLLQTP